MDEDVDEEINNSDINDDQNSVDDDDETINIASYSTDSDIE